MLAGVAAFGAARPAACATAPPPPPEAGSPAAAAQPEGDGAGVDARLRVPPIGFWGSLAYDLRGQDTPSPDADGGLRSLQHYVTARLEGATYIWQPWFGNVNAAVGLTTGWLDAGGDAPPGRDRFVTGRAQLNLFPVSHFPFEAHYDVTDTRVDSGLVALPPARWTRVGLSQSYRPEGAPYQVYGRFERVAQESVSLGTDAQLALDLNGSARWSAHDVSVSLTATRNRRDFSNEQVDYASVYTRHSYAPSPDFAFESNANATLNEYGDSRATVSTHVLQYVGIANWRPIRSPYWLTGTLRFLSVEGDAGGRSRSGTATLGGTYEASQNLRYTGNAATTFTTTPGNSQWLSAASAGVEYVGDTIALGAWRYDWNASSALSGAWRSSAGARVIDEPRDPLERGGSMLALSGAASHSLTRSLQLADGQAITGVASQSVTAIGTTGRSEGREDAVLLATDLSITYSAGGGPLSGYARLSLTDSRSLTRSDSVFQIANLQVSGNWGLSRYSEVAGDVTAQFVRSETPPRRLLTPDVIADGGTRTAIGGISANIAYRHRRAFGVPRLRFVSELRIADETVLEQERRQLLPNRESASWENRLDYTIGRLLFSLSLRVSEINQSRTSLLMLRVQRDFEGVAFR